MQERGIQYIKPKELCAQYVNYTKEALPKKPLEYHPFTVQLEQIGIKIFYNVRYCGVRTNYYTVEFAALKEIPDKYKWFTRARLITRRRKWSMTPSRNRTISVTKRRMRL